MNARVHDLCTHGNGDRIAPRSGPGRVWSEDGQKLTLPDDLVVSQCDECGGMFPTGGEQREIARWLDGIAPLPGVRPSSLSARTLGRGEGPPRLGDFTLVWPKSRHRVASGLDLIAGRRLEHVIEGARSMVTLRDASDGRWFGVRVDQRFDAVRWVFVPVSKYGWRGLLEGLHPVDALFALHDGDLEVVDYDTRGIPTLYSPTTYDELPPELRPFGDLPAAERQSLRETLVEMPAERIVVFDGPRVSRHSIGFLALDDLLHPIARIFKECLEQLGETARALSEPRLVPVEGSFALQVDGGERVFDHAWERVEHALHAADDPVRLAQLFEQEPSLIDAFKGLLEGVKSSRLELYLKTPKIRLHINPPGARRCVERVDNARRLVDERATLIEGYFLAFNTNGQGFFALRDIHGERTIDGALSRHIRDEHTNQRFKPVISPAEIYRARVQQVSLKKKRQYLLLSAEPSSPAREKAP